MASQSVAMLILVSIATLQMEMSCADRVTAADVLAKAIEQLEYVEGEHNLNKYAADEDFGMQGDQNKPWCDIFVNWCFFKAGQEVPKYVKSAVVRDTMKAWRSAGRFSEYPAIGAQVIFGRNASKHTGLVERYDKTYIYTIEGNYKNSNGDYGVFRASRKRNEEGCPEWKCPDYGYVYGYGYPEYATPIVSADPNYGGVPFASN